LKYAVLVLTEKKENLAVQIGLITGLAVYVAFAVFLEKKMDYVISIEKIMEIGRFIEENRYSVVKEQAYRFPKGCFLSHPMSSQVRC